MLNQLHEVYIRTIGGKIAAEYSGISFPTDCSKNWSFNCPQLYLLDDQAQACPVKRIRPVSLMPEEIRMRIPDNLAILFNMSKTEVLLLPGHPKLTIHPTSLGMVSTTLDEGAAGLLEVVSWDVRSNRYLIQTLQRLEHHNGSASIVPNDKVERVDCTTCVDIQNDQDYIPPLRREPGLLVHPNGESMYKDLCKRIEVPIAETPIGFQQGVSAVK